MFEQAFKNIDDVLWKEAGCTTELDYTEQTSWLLFLKIGQIFAEIKNKIHSGYNLRNIIDHIDELRFRSQTEKHELSHLYEAVSYTHLDVYKRQSENCMGAGSRVVLPMRSCGKRCAV